MGILGYNVIPVVYIIPSMTLGLWELPGGLYGPSECL